MNTIDLDKKLPFDTLAECFKKHPIWKLSNDMIEKVSITMDRGFILGIEIQFVSGRQPWFSQRHNTANIGIVLNNLARLIGREFDRCDDLLESFMNCPVRVIQNQEFYGGYVSQNSFIGHFMEDNFVLFDDLLLSGISKAED